MDTENYQIDGKNGNWMATDTIIIDGKQFYLISKKSFDEWLDKLAEVQLNTVTHSRTCEEW